MILQSFSLLALLSIPLCYSSHFHLLSSTLLFLLFPLSPPIPSLFSTPLPLLLFINAPLPHHTHTHTHHHTHSRLRDNDPTPIWLDEVTFCRTTALTLLDCDHNPIGDHDCFHQNDVFLSCRTLASPKDTTTEGPSTQISVPGAGTNIAGMSTEYSGRIP